MKYYSYVVIGYFYVKLSVDHASDSLSIVFDRWIKNTTDSAICRWTTYNMCNGHQGANVLLLKHEG